MFPYLRNAHHAVHPNQSSIRPSRVDLRMCLREWRDPNLYAEVVLEEVHLRLLEVVLRTSGGSNAIVKQDCSQEGNTSSLRSLTCSRSEHSCFSSRTRTATAVDIVVDSQCFLLEPAAWIGWRRRLCYPCDILTGCDLRTGNVKGEPRDIASSQMKPQKTVGHIPRRKIPPSMTISKLFPRRVL